METLFQIASSRCKRCHQKVESNLPHLGPLCRKCFCRILEKRIRKYVRLNQLFKKNDRILVTDPLSHALLKSIIEGLPVKIDYKKINAKKLMDEKVQAYITKNKFNKIIMPWTADDEAQLLLEKLFHNRKVKKSEGSASSDFRLQKPSISTLKGGVFGLFEVKEDKKIIRLLKPILDEEATLLAKFKKVSFNPNKKDKELKKFIDQLKKTNQGAVFGLMKSHEQLKGLL